MVSIIIPIYNVENYLVNCLNSVINQSYKNLEIILVNDGSSDNSQNICEEFAKKDGRIRIINKKNGGLSDARNTGTKICSGQWVFYLDSDDWLDETIIEKLITFAQENKCDIVQSNFYYTFDSYLSYRRTKPWEQNCNILDRKEAMKSIIMNDRIKNFAWGKLYKSELVKTELFPFGKYFEDCYWQHRVLHKINKYGIINEPLYYYRQRENSISGTFSLRNIDLLKGYEERLHFIKNYYPELESKMTSSFSNLVQHFYGNPQTLNIPEYKNYFNYLKENFNFELKQSVIYRIKTLINKVYNRLYPPFIIVKEKHA